MLCRSAGVANHPASARSYVPTSSYSFDGMESMPARVANWSARRYVPTSDSPYDSMLCGRREWQIALHGVLSLRSTKKFFVTKRSEGLLPDGDLLMCCDR